MLRKIIKRDGNVADFDPLKIASAIVKAGEATGEFGTNVARKLTDQVLSLANELSLGPLPCVENIQDVVERVLFSTPYFKTAKAYILYREQHAQISKTGEKKIGPYQERKKFMKTLCKKVGVRYFRFHALRHSGASLMDNNNVPIGAIQRILGHENRTTTEIYLHSIGNTERDAIHIFEAATEKSLPKSLPSKKEGAAETG